MRKLALFLLVPLLALTLSSCADNRPWGWEEERTVYFAFGSANLTQEAKVTLDNLANRLSRDNTIAAVSIVGYADHIGSADANERLSKRRADTVKRYLEKRGYRHAHIGDTRWVGESRSNPACGDVANRDTIACLSPDRKVEVIYIAAWSDYCSHDNRRCRQPAGWGQ